MDGSGCELVRARFVVLAAAFLALPSASAHAQNRFRVLADGGLQVTEQPFEQVLNFQQYFEAGSLRFDRPVPRVPFFDAGLAVRVTRGGIHAGATFSFFSDTRGGTVTADVPHPLHFTELRTVTGEAQSTAHRETAVHTQVSWTAPAPFARGAELTIFGGPSIFLTNQSYVSGLNLSLSDEVYPFDTLSFPEVSTATFKETILGVNVGADLTWRLARNFGLGTLVRYSHGKKNVTPTDSGSVDLKVGGLHVGGGLRLVF
jgi:hypothetical protein